MAMIGSWETYGPGDGEAFAHWDLLAEGRRLGRIAGGSVANGLSVGRRESRECHRGDGEKRELHGEYVRLDRKG